MPLIKRDYTDEETVITAQNLNDIQDAIQALEEGLFTIDDDRSGEVITTTDAAKRGFKSFNIYGKTWQDGKPTPAAPVELVSVGDGGSVTVSVMGKNILPYPYMDTTKTTNGVTFTVNRDGSIAASGTATGSVNFWFAGYTFKLKKGVTYTLSLGDEFSITGEPYLWVASSTSNIIAGINMSNKRTATFTPTEDVYDAAVYMIAGTTGGVFSGTIRPQIEVGAVATTYEPYKAQKLTIATPNGMPGVPVASGGNYTDADGQQWICDEIDLARGVYVKRVGSRVYDGSNDEYWYSENPLASTAMFRIGVLDGVNAANVVGKDFVCTHFEPNGIYSIDTEGAQHSGQQFYFRILKSALISEDVAGFQKFLAASPMTIKYVLSAPVETPLSVAELGAYAAMHTNKDHTTVSNADLAYMDLEYVMDAKTYIDGVLKLNEAPRIVNINLPASKWIGTGNLFSQEVYLPGITANSQVNLTPTISQMATFYEKDITFITENDGGVVTVYVVGQKPQNDYTIPANIVEVRV